MKNERYVVVEDIEKSKSLSKVYFHKSCWHEWATKSELQETELKKAGALLNKIASEAGFNTDIEVRL